MSTITTAFVSIREACHITGMAYVSINRLCYEGGIDGAYKQDGVWRVPREWADHKAAERRARAANGHGNGK